MRSTIFLDEAGDTGWTLDKPYRNGGSSRFLVLGALITNVHNERNVQRIARDLYKNRNNRPLSKELKSIELNNGERKSIAVKLSNLARRQEHPVQLLAVVAQLEFADFIPDARTLKQRDQHTLHTYQETRLAIAGHMPEITTTPSGSDNYLELQVADYLCSIVWNHFEYQNSEAFDWVKPHLRLQQLF